MADHTEFVELAQELIAEEGRLISLLALGAPAADPTKPWNGAGAPAPVLLGTVHAVFLPASGPGMGSIVTDKDLLKKVREVALVAPLTGVDLSTATLLRDGVDYRVEWVQVLKPADQVCLYVFGVTR